MDRDAEIPYSFPQQAELKIRYLHQKVDHLMSHQWEMLVEIQEVQMEFLDALRAESHKKSSKPSD